MKARRIRSGPRRLLPFMQDGQPKTLTKDELGVLNVSKISLPLQA
jgi:hypothetical protein